MALFCEQYKLYFRINLEKPDLQLDYINEVKMFITPYTDVKKPAPSVFSV